MVILHGFTVSRRSLGGTVEILTYQLLVVNLDPDWPRCKDAGERRPLPTLSSPYSVSVAVNV
jgi:hypothetical protein